VLIVEHQLRPQQVRPANVPTAKVATMTRTAVDFVERFALFNDGRIGQFALLRRELDATPALTAAAAGRRCLGRLRRLRLGRSCRRWRLRRALSACMPGKDRECRERRTGEGSPYTHPGILGDGRAQGQVADNSWRS
jgi:hypothetical protein